MYVGIDERLAFYGSKSVGSWNLREIVRSFRGKLRCTRERGCSQDTRTSFTRALPPRQHRDPWPATTPAPPTLPPSTPTLVVSRKRKHLSLPAIRTPPTARRFFTCCRPRLEPDPRRLPQQQEQVENLLLLPHLSSQRLSPSATRRPGGTSSSSATPPTPSKSPLNESLTTLALGSFARSPSS